MIQVLFTLNLDFFYTSFSNGERACEPSESNWSPLPMDTRNSREVTIALPVSWVGIEYPIEGRVEIKPSQLSLTGRIATAEAVTWAKLYTVTGDGSVVKSVAVGPGGFPCSILTIDELNGEWFNLSQITPYAPWLRGQVKLPARDVVLASAMTSVDGLRPAPDRPGLSGSV
ncbi:hypothetical protein EVAR_84702_1 [Eumeta japonica]|uniref:Uncharacterized protein n=1 Tax=Eumeta variegata TaxID=151549 RepID=A0A4C1VT27_EUMVA|nr:hypothetical protein EVAR_84702_1 [Eumeta japonica]